MKRLLLCLLPCLLSAANAQNAAPVLKLEQNEIALEGRIVSVDALKNEVQLDATAFGTQKGRQTFAKVKSKMLRLSAKTKFFDERTQRVAAITDLKRGDTVRAAGRDGGSGKALAVRFITWSSTEPFDPDVPPALRSLLPSSEKWKGMDVRVVDAGFKPRAQLWPTMNMAPQSITWMIVARGASSDALRLLGIDSPDGLLSRANDQGPWPLANGTKGTAWEFGDVTPAWKTVRAHFELMAPNAPADTLGEFSEQLPVEIPVPDAPNGILEPGTKFQTARGAIIELVRVEALEANKHLKINWKWTPPADATDAHVLFNLGSLQSGDKPIYGVGMSVGGNDGKSGAVEEEIGTLPRGAVLKGNLLVSESADSWRKTEFLHRFDVELPVAPITKALAPPRLENRPAPIEVQAPQGLARLEASHREGPYAVLPLWLSVKTDETNAKTGIEQRLVMREARIQPDGGGEETKFTFRGADGDTFWHDDRSLAAPGETGWRVSVLTRKAQKVQISATAQVASIFDGDHQIKNIPIPARGKTRSLEQDDFGDDVVNVRKVAWVEPDRWKDNAFVRDNLRLALGSRGAVVVVCDLLRVWPGSEREFKNFSLSDSTGKVYGNGENVAWNGDLLETGAMSPTTISFAVPAPAGAVKSLNVSFHLRETSLGTTVQFKFPSVELEAEAP